MLILLNRMAADPEAELEPQQLCATARRDSFTQKRPTKDMQHVNVDCQSQPEGARMLQVRSHQAIVCTSQFSCIQVLATFSLKSQWDSISVSRSSCAGGPASFPEQAGQGSGARGCSVSESTAG